MDGDGSIENVYKPPARREENSGIAAWPIGESVSTWLAG